MKAIVLSIALAGVLMTSATAALAQTSTAAVKVNPLREAYYGDLHLHTSYSLDAYLSGTTSVGPDEAYRFAKGEAVDYLGQSVQRREPLDFLAVTDHAENLGVLNTFEDPDNPASQSDMAKAAKSLQTKPTDQRDMNERSSFWDRYFLGSKNQLPESLKPAASAAWAREIEFANHHYQPGKFTTFIGYEWTAFQNGGNLHRNVIFRGDSAPYPFTSLDSKFPEDLWAWLEAIRKQGFEALAIPHNGNGSNGLMYDWIGSFLYMTKAYAEQRQANEPLSEISQVKGTSETHPLLSPNDEFADYQIFDFVAARRRHDGRAQGSYLRDALSRGLVLQRELGVNPYKYGFVGGSDIHVGLSVSAQADAGGFDKVNVGVGKIAAEEAARLLSEPGQVHQRKVSAGSLTGVWAESNTRESIYNALRRRETFATTGTRLKFRFFGGWNFDKRLLQTKEWIGRSYALGVPMGGDLPARPPGAIAPDFVVWAIKDPNGANLDRLQVVKVWEENGEQMEKIFDVAWSGHRTVDPKTGSVPAVGNPVDLATGRFTNDVGATELKAVWTDPEFKPQRLAAYYLRVLEVPTPRWTTLLAIRHGLELPKDVPPTIQQRGWSSPIWSAH